MKKIFLLISVLTVWVFAKLPVVVSILPQQAFVKAIGGDKVEVHLMVQPGNSPHTYEPKPLQMRQISTAQLYFAIGVEFEATWMDKFISQNPKMKVVDLSKGITKLPVAAHRHGEKEHHHAGHEHHSEERLDPHVWTSPENVKVIAKNIYEALLANDSVNREYYTKKYEEFIMSIDATDQQIKTVLSSVKKGTKFMVFHPAWGYFAHQYGLVQIAIESGGKNPKPRQVTHLIKEAKEEKVRAVFTAPEFSDETARVISQEVGIPVVKISPLNPKWSKNLIRLAKSIAGK